LTKILLENFWFWITKIWVIFDLIIIFMVSIMLLSIVWFPLDLNWLVLGIFHLLKIFEVIFLLFLFFLLWSFFLMAKHFNYYNLDYY
jgi:hypothetical protein